MMTSYSENGYIYEFGFKVRLFLDCSCAILSSFKIVVIFNNTTAEIKTMSADVLLKIFKELRIAQLRSINKPTFLSKFYQILLLILLLSTVQEGNSPADHRNLHRAVVTGEG